MDQIVADFNRKIIEAQNVMGSIQNNLVTKLNIQQFNEQMATKLSLTEFERWFPTKEFDDPKQFFKTLVSDEVEQLQKSMTDMVKLWDQKLVKMRSDLNIASVVRRMGEKADANIVNDTFEQHTQRVDQIEKTFL